MLDISDGVDIGFPNEDVGAAAVGKCGRRGRKSGCHSSSGVVPISGVAVDNAWFRGPLVSIVVKGIGSHDFAIGTDVAAWTVHKAVEPGLGGGGGPGGYAEVGRLVMVPPLSPAAGSATRSALVLRCWGRYWSRGRRWSRNGVRVTEIGGEWLEVGGVEAEEVNEARERLGGAGRVLHVIVREDSRQVRDMLNRRTEVVDFVELRQRVTSGQEGGVGVGVPRENVRQGVRPRQGLPEEGIELTNTSGCGG